MRDLGLTKYDIMKAKNVSRTTVDYWESRGIIARLNTGTRTVYYDPVKTECALGVAIPKASRQRPGRKFKTDDPIDTL